MVSRKDICGEKWYIFCCYVGLLFLMKGMRHQYRREPDIKEVPNYCGYWGMKKHSFSHILDSETYSGVTHSSAETTGRTKVDRMKRIIK